MPLRRKRPAPNRPSSIARAKMSGKHLYGELTKPKEQCWLSFWGSAPGGAGKSQLGKELANALDGAYLRRVTNSDRIRAVGSFFDRAGVCRDHRVMAFRPREQRRGGLSTYWIACRSRWSGERVPAEDGGGSQDRPAGQRPARGSDRDMGALRRRLNCGVSATRCFQVDDVPMANPQVSGRHSGGGSAPSWRGRIRTGS